MMGKIKWLEVSVWTGLAITVAGMIILYGVGIYHFATIIWPQLGSYGRIVAVAFLLIFSGALVIGSGISFARNDR